MADVEAAVTARHRLRALELALPSAGAPLWMYTWVRTGTAMVFPDGWQFDEPRAKQEQLIEIARQLAFMEASNATFVAIRKEDYNQLMLASNILWDLVEHPGAAGLVGDTRLAAWVEQEKAVRLRAGG